YRQKRDASGWDDITFNLPLGWPSHNYLLYDIMKIGTTNLGTLTMAIDSSVQPVNGDPGYGGIALFYLNEQQGKWNEKKSPSFSIFDLCSTSNSFFIVGYKGIYRSNDDGDSWQRVSDSISFSII